MSNYFYLPLRQLDALLLSIKVRQKIFKDHEIMIQNQMIEQNQNQVQLPQKNSQSPQDKEWQNLRNQFATNQESIGQNSDVVALIQKWIWIQHEQQFKIYQQKLKEKPAFNRDLKSIISEIIQQEKQSSWIINQKYSMQHVNQMISQIRVKLNHIIQEEGGPLNPEKVIINEENQQKNEMKLEKVDVERQQIKPMIGHRSSLFPQIRPTGKLYKPDQLTDTFRLTQEIQQQYKMKSPFMFQGNQRQLKKSDKQPIFNNKYLKMAYKSFCKQGYNSKGLFSDISQSSDKMSLNKWMVFCKQFEFIDKFSKKDLISTYQEACNFASAMSLQEFLMGVSLLQQKYLSKFHSGQHNFVSDVLKINSEAAFRIKMDNLKVRYSGPRKNFFEQGTYLEYQRQQQLQREKFFQIKKRQRQIVLIKGMFEDHLKDQIKQLKEKKQQYKLSRLGKSLHMIQPKQKSNDNPSINNKTSRIQNLNYSKIFQMTKGQKGQIDTNNTTTNTGLTQSKMYKTDVPNMKEKKEQIRRNEVKTVMEKHSKLNETQNQKKIPIINEKQEEHTWLTNIRTDTEQSDEILKQHLQIQKKIKNSSQLGRVHKIMQQMAQHAKKVEKIKGQIDNQNLRDQDEMETQINFRKQKQFFL